MLIKFVVAHFFLHKKKFIYEELSLLDTHTFHLSWISMVTYKNNQHAELKLKSIINNWRTNAWTFIDGPVSVKLRSLALLCLSSRTGMTKISSSCLAFLSLQFSMWNRNQMSNWGSHQELVRSHLHGLPTMLLPWNWWWNYPSQAFLVALMCFSRTTRKTSAFLCFCKWRDVKSIMINYI